MFDYAEKKKLFLLSTHDKNQPQRLLSSVVGSVLQVHAHLSSAQRIKHAVHGAKNALNPKESKRCSPPPPAQLLRENLSFEQNNMTRNGFLDICICADEVMAGSCYRTCVSVCLSVCLSVCVCVCVCVCVLDVLWERGVERCEVWGVVVTDGRRTASNWE